MRLWLIIKSKAFCFRRRFGHIQISLPHLEITSTPRPSHPIFSPDFLGSLTPLLQYRSLLPFFHSSVPTLSLHSLDPLLHLTLLTIHFVTHSLILLSLSHPTPKSHSIPSPLSFPIFNYTSPPLTPPSHFLFLPHSLNLSLRILTITLNLSTPTISPLSSRISTYLSPVSQPTFSEISFPHYTPFSNAYPRHSLIPLYHKISNPTLSPHSFLPLSTLSSQSNSLIPLSHSPHHILSPSSLSLFLFSFNTTLSSLFLFSPYYLPTLTLLSHPTHLAFPISSRSTLII